MQSITLDVLFILVEEMEFIRCQELMYRYLHLAKYELLTLVYIAEGRHS